jgi:hypothetical protein
VFKSKPGGTDIKLYAGLFCIALFAVFISCLNPLGSRGFNTDADTSVYLTVAQGIARSLVPYRDFFDNKGPLLYLLSVPGMLLGKFAGVWFTELLFMLVSVSFAYKTALFFGNRAAAFGGTACGFIIFASFFQDPAGAEEYALPFMMISLYIVVKYYFTAKGPKIWELVCLGFCFASSMLIRINMFPLWLGFCGVIFFESLIKKEFLNLLKYFVFFCAGAVIAVVPVFLYLYVNGAFWEYIRQNIGGGSARAMNNFSAKDFVESFFIIINKTYCFSPLLLGLLWLIKTPHTKKRGFYAGYIAAYIFTVFSLALVRTNFDHYNITFIPFLVPVFTFFTPLLYDYFSPAKHRALWVLAVLCVMFSHPLLRWAYYGQKLFTDKSGMDLAELGRIIDRHTAPEDIFISMDWPAELYLFTRRNSASRYIYQTSGVIQYDRERQNEFLSDIYKNRPAIIAVRNEGGRYDHLPSWYAPVYALIENEYRLLSDKNNYFLFLRNR